MQLWYLVCVLWGRCLSTFILFVVVVRIYSVIIYSKTIDFFLNFFFFKKRNKQCLYPDSLGPRKIRRAVVDLVIGRVSSWVDPSIFCPSRRTVFFSFLLFFSLKNDTKLLEIKSEQHGFLYLRLHCSVHMCWSWEWEWVSMLCKLAHAK